MADALKSEFGEHHFVEVWDKAWTPVLDLHAVVVADVRLEVEAQRVKARGGVIVRVDRATDTNFPGADHHTEDGIPDAMCDHIIQNDGSLDDLFKKADLIVSIL